MKRKACECLRVPPEGHFQKSLIMRHKNLMIRDFLWQDHTTFAGSYDICRIIRHLQDHTAFAGRAGRFLKKQFRPASSADALFWRCFGAVLVLFLCCFCTVLVQFRSDR